MTRLRGPWPVVLLIGFGTLLGLTLLESALRLAAVREERRQGRLDRDLSGVRFPSAGSVATLGQMIRKSENPKIVYELRPRLDVVFAGGRVTTSDAAFRGRDVASPKPAGVYRIVGVGDSYMFGQGVSDDETYLARLAALVQTAVPDRSIETVNLAVPGYNAAMEAATLGARGAALQPDLILIETVGNDLDLPNFLWNTVDPWTLGRLFLVDFVRERLAAKAGSEISALGLAEAPRDGTGSAEVFTRDLGRVPPQYVSMVGMPAFERAIADLAEFGRANRVPVLALTHGVWFEDAMSRSFEHNGIPVLILRSALRKRARDLGAPDYARSPLALSAQDLHPSSLGHRAIAEELALWIPPHLKKS